MQFELQEVASQPEPAERAASFEPLGQRLQRWAEMAADLPVEAMDQQLRDLFEGSGLTAFDQVAGEGRNANAWVAAFKDKVKQIREAGPCATSPS